MHSFVDPAIGVSVSLVPLFFARNEMMVDGEFGSAPFTWKATAVYPFVFDVVIRPVRPSEVVNSFPLIVSVVSPIRPAASHLKVPA
jgi:hypothetical protein